MFTGIITAKGKIKNKLIDQNDRSVRLIITTPEGFLAHTKLGDSIAVNGVCLTVMHFEYTDFSVEISEESLQRTNLNKLPIDSVVNLEHALKFGDSLDGHLMQGHVDTTAQVQEIVCIKDNKKIVAKLADPASYMKFIAEKGSVTLNGVSLTVNHVTHNNFAVNIIPYTLEHTNLNNIKIGDELNLEVDMFARYCVNYLEHSNLTTCVSQAS